MSSGATALLASRCGSVSKFVRGPAAPEESLEKNIEGRRLVRERYRENQVLSIDFCSTFSKRFTCRSQKTPSCRSVVTRRQACILTLVKRPELLLEAAWMPKYLVGRPLQAGTPRSPTKCVGLVCLSEFTEDPLFI